MYEAYKCRTPFGVHSNYRYIDPYPPYFHSGEGDRIRDVDGNEYIDFNMNFGELLTGHAHPVFVEALTNQEVIDWRSFLQCSVGKWFSYYLSMLNRHVIPSGTGSDEQWTVSVQQRKEDIDANVDAFKEVAEIVRKFEEFMPMVEAI